MPLPTSAEILTRPMDPSDLRKYGIIFKQGPADSDFLEANEAITSLTISPGPEALALGLTLKSDGTYSTVYDPAALRLTFFPEVDATRQGDTKFNTEQIVPIEVTVVTNTTPPQRKQRTFGLRIVNR